MNTFIHEIGVIDNNHVKHPVKFKRGLNVVTGKSSTGKSALIEICDFCLGSSENTIPVGVITKCAELYYMVLSIKQQIIVVARKPNAQKDCFLKNISVDEIDDLEWNTFESRSFISLENFKKDLRNSFIDISSVDESLEVKRLRGRSAPTPSIRSFVSFMLQHQNLVANKHALFYRFDEKEERDQVIEHTKIFLGIVDQRYFLLMQEIEDKINTLRMIKRQIEMNTKLNERNKQEIGPTLAHLYSRIGCEEPPLTLDEILLNPQNAKVKLNQIVEKGKIIYSSEEEEKRYDDIEKQRDAAVADLRKMQRERNSLKKRLGISENFAESLSKQNNPKKANVSTTVCPFCRTEKTSLSQSAVSLQKHLNQLRQFILASPLNSVFEKKLSEIEREIEVKKEQIDSLNSQLKEIDDLNQQLREKRSEYEAILELKVRLFFLLDSINGVNDTGLDEKLKNIQGELDQKESELKKYNLQNKLSEMTNKVNRYMAEIGQNFDFEKDYQPINLQFSFESFDLFHLNKENQKVYLRSMGSGANWLYSHITLFLALHKLFVELGDKCSIPSVLFFDQPTQVYFPNFKRDNSSSFDEQKILEEEQRTSNNENRTVDEDIKSVENLFSRLSSFCLDLEKKFGFCPQIIVTDHADDLTLSNGVSFESLVNGNRWRTRGFINPVE